MPGKKYSVGQIVAKLREAERLQGQGLTIRQLCKRLGISDQTFYPWRLKYGALKEDEAQRLKRTTMRATASHEHRRSLAIVVLWARWASQATTSSKSLV
jgi:transposase